MQITRKIPISFNSQEYETLTELGVLLGFGSHDTHFGSVPKVIKFSIKCLRNSILSVDKFIPDLKDDELDRFLCSIKILRQERKKAELAKNEPKSITQTLP